MDWSFGEDSWSGTSEGNCGVELTGIFFPSPLNGFGVISNFILKRKDGEAAVFSVSLCSLNN